MEITDDSISVVIQGPVVCGGSYSPDVFTTAAVVESVRRFLPNAEVILSTWEGATCEQLPVDIVVTSKDPGAFPVNEAGTRVPLNNLNRMLVSTIAGLGRCSRPFAIKLRTDTPLRAPPDFDAITPVKCEPSSQLFERRVLVPNIYTRHPLKRPVLFHLSDLVQFGSTTDLRTLWCIPLVDDPGFTQWNRDRRPSRFNVYPEMQYDFRCAPEQYLIETLARRICPQIFLTHPGDGRASWLFLWLRLLATHFAIQPYENFFATLPRRMAEHSHSFDLFAADDLLWLKKWESHEIPLRFRVQTLAGYLMAKRRYTRPSLYRFYGSAVKRRIRRAITGKSF